MPAETPIIRPVSHPAAKQTTQAALPSLPHLIDVIRPSPLQAIHTPLLNKAGIQLYIKRDDLIHPHFGGNKWRKLKYNLIEARNNRFDTLLSFGGAWSNHIYATAAAAKHFGFNSIGVIRGKAKKPLNTCLAFASDSGMSLKFIDRQQYRKKHQPEFINELEQRYGNIYIIPEGGSNSLAVKGCEEITKEIQCELSQPFDVICSASGTGGTLAGLITAMEKTTISHTQEAIGFSILKGGEFLNDEVRKLIPGQNNKTSWRIETGYHFGGYGKITDELIEFMQTFEKQTNIKLDAVYTAKMFYGLFDMIRSGRFKPGTTIVALHTGGLQGNKGFNL